MIGRNGERRSGISAQTARHDDDDIYIYMIDLINSLCKIHRLHTHTHAYIYIYIYIGTLQSSKSGLGTIPPGQINYSNFEYLNIPGRELNANEFTEQIKLFQ